MNVLYCCLGYLLPDSLILVVYKPEPVPPSPRLNMSLTFKRKLATTCSGSKSEQGRHFCPTWMFNPLSGKLFHHNGTNPSYPTYKHGRHMFTKRFNPLKVLNMVSRVTGLGSLTPMVKTCLRWLKIHAARSAKGTDASTMGIHGLEAFQLSAKAEV